MEFVVIQVGKRGFNEELISDINKHLRQKKNVKLKLLNNFLDSAEIDRKQAFANLKSILAQDLRLKLVGKVIFIEKLR